MKNKLLRNISLGVVCLLGVGGLIGVSQISEHKYQAAEAEIDPNYGKPVYNSSAKTITYGLYPKTVVSDTDLITTLNGLDDSAYNENLGWYVYNGNYYQKVTATPHTAGYKFSNGATVVNGDNYWFKCEPITWKVLTTSGTKHIAIANVVIDKGVYLSGGSRTIGGKTVYANNYKYSNIRAWLNGYDGSSYSAGNHTGKGFIDIAFGLDTIDPSYILTTTVDNSLASTRDKTNPYICENTNDKVWLLSSKEVTSYYKNNNSRKTKPSDFALARGVYYEDSNAYWYLRTPYYYFNNAYLDVQGDGSISYSFTYTDYEGARPVMQFNTINHSEVIDRINNIGSVEYTTECKTKIDLARNGYNALASEQKALVTNYQTLVDAETVYGNYKAAGDVDALINAIGTVAYPDSKQAIGNAHSAYDALTAVQKALVTNLTTLTDAETAYNNLRDAAVNNVINLINAIGTVSYPEPDSGDAIDAARTACNNLDAEDVTLVTNYQTLVDAENQYQKLVDDYNAADAVEIVIDAIGEVTLSDESKGKIDDAREAYDALTADQKPLVDNYSTLTDAEARYAKLKADSEAADAVIALINAIGEVELTNTCKAKIDAANEAYEALTIDQKELVTNKKVLFDAIELYDTLAHQPEVNDNGVAVEGKDGELIPVNVTIQVEIKTSVKAEKGSTEYYNIQKEIGSNQKIAGVYDVKLIRTVGEVQTEIQPSDIKNGMVIIVEITLPDGLEIEGLRVLHIHSETDITYVENYTISGNKLSFETDRLSEFAFVVPAPNAGLPGWAIALIVIGGLLLLCALFLLVLFIFFPRYIVDYSKKKVIRTIYVKKHFDMVLMLDTHLRKVRRNIVDVYKTKEEAEQALNK